MEKAPTAAGAQPERGREVPVTVRQVTEAMEDSADSEVTAAHTAETLRAADGPKINAAINYVNSGHYAEAMNILNDMPLPERNARWHYVHAYANYGMGNVVNAREDARRAVELEPGNQDYVNLLNQLENGGNWYQNMGNAYGGTGSTTGSCCMRLLCLEMFLNCCCCSGSRFFYC